MFRTVSSTASLATGFLVVISFAFAAWTPAGQPDRADRIEVSERGPDADVVSPLPQTPHSAGGEVTGASEGARRRRTLAANYQDTSVRPGINDPFRAPDVSQFVERFEREGREVFDHREAIVDAIGAKEGQTVADIGCGTGLFTRLIAARVGTSGRVIAVDIARSFVEHTLESCAEARLTQVEGVHCRPDSADLPPASVDIAFICDTYHHFEFPYKTMRSIRRALRPGGRVVLVEFHRKEGESSDWILGHVRAGRDVFVEEIERAGFRLASEDSELLETSYLVHFDLDDRVTKLGHTVDSLELLREQLESGVATLLDVREEREWSEGHLRDASLVPLSGIVLAETDADAMARLRALLPRDKVLYCHCRSGGRVLRAAQILAREGYDIRPLATGYEGLVEAGFERAPRSE